MKNNRIVKSKLYSKKSRKSRNKKKSPSLRRQFIIQAVVTVILLIATLSMSVLVRIQKEKLLKVQTQAKDSYYMAEELRQTAEDLTRLCRSFVVTKGDELYEDAYFDILDWRSGQLPRPDTVSNGLYIGETISHRDIFEILGCTEDELALLDKSTELSNTLSLIETQAMGTIKQKMRTPGIREMLENETYYDFAVRILHDYDHRDEFLKIMQPIDEFIIKLNDRTQKNINKYDSRVGL